MGIPWEDDDQVGTDPRNATCDGGISSTASRRPGPPLGDAGQGSEGNPYPRGRSSALRREGRVEGHPAPRTPNTQHRNWGSGVRGLGSGVPSPDPRPLAPGPFLLSNTHLVAYLPSLAFLFLLACAVRPGPAQVTVEPVVEWTAPGDVAELRWTGNGWAAWLPAEGTVVYWPSDAPKDVPPVRWSDERWQSPHAWAVMDGTAWLATPTELLAFSGESTGPSTRMAWPEGATVWDDGRRLWVGHTSDDVRICTPGAVPAASECWSFPAEAVRPDFSLPAWAWSPPWWCGLRFGESDAGGVRPAELVCQRGIRVGSPVTAIRPSPVFSRMNSVSNPVNTRVDRTDPGKVPPEGMEGRGAPQRHGVCTTHSDVPPTGGGCARPDVRRGGWPYPENPCEGGRVASTLRWWVCVSAVAAGEGPRAKGSRLSGRVSPAEGPEAAPGAFVIAHRPNSRMPERSNSRVPEFAVPARAPTHIRSGQGRAEAETLEPVAWRKSFQVPAGADVTVLRVWIVSTGVFVSTGRWAWLWDLERGRLRWRLDLGASVTVRPVQTAGDVLMVATRGLLLYALDARNGNRLWVLPLRAPVTRMLLMQDAGWEGPSGTQAPLARAGSGTSAWVVLTLMDEPPTVVDVATGKTLWQATGWTAWDAALGADSTVAWAGADRKIRVFRIRSQPTAQMALRPSAERSSTRP